MATIDALRSDAAGCTRCPLYADATATVFGEGPANARVVVVGEQPGDQEDRQGRPFVGPAGRVLDRALHQSGIARSEMYLTNAVKHFKFTQRGARRIHATPNQTEVVACRPWLEGELEALTPDLVVALGATAGKALLGPGFRVTQQRGRPLPASLGAWSGTVVATVHPSAILRIKEPDARDTAFEDLVADLRGAAAVLG